MGVLGNKSKDTVKKRNCSKDEDKGKAVCDFKIEDDDGTIKKHGILEADLDENGEVTDIDHSIAGFEDDEVENLEREMEKWAERHSEGGITAGNTEL